MGSPLSRKVWSKGMDDGRMPIPVKSGGLGECKKSLEAIPAKKKQLSAGGRETCDVRKQAESGALAGKKREKLTRELWKVDSTRKWNENAILGPDADDRHMQRLHGDSKM